jgi:hypothetical protein
VSRVGRHNAGVSLRVALFIVLMIGFVDVIAALQYKDDEPNPWYVELSWSAFPLIVLIVIILLSAAASRAWRRRRGTRAP